MKKITVGIVNYGVGNHASVRHTLTELGWRCRTSDEPSVLDACDVLLLPGVGAFRPAIEALRARGLDRYLIERANTNHPLLGICLGMQLLAQGSHEDGFTHGLGLVPGEVVGLPAPHWHIGWNTIVQFQVDPLFDGANGQVFYFNHSYAYRGPIEFQVCTTMAGREFASVIRKDNIVGVQFHPEKSQEAGRALLRNIIIGLFNA